MESLNELKEYGESLGYKDEDLRRFIQEQQIIMRDERAAIRQKEKDEMSFKLEMESKALERERQEQQYKLTQQDLENKQKIDELHLKSSEKSSETHASTPKFPKIPPFEDGKDDMDSYLRRFERYAGVQKWPKPTWATHLSALLKGRALDV